MRKMGSFISALLAVIALLFYGVDAQAFGGLPMMRGITSGAQAARGIGAAKGFARGGYRVMTGSGKSGARQQGIWVIGKNRPSVNLTGHTNSWNSFQKATKGAFSNRRQAGSAWGTVKNIRGIRSTPSPTTRSNAVRSAWGQEQKLVSLTGRGTRKWIAAERRELLATGRVKGYEGHHINSVKSHPGLAGNPNNIRFMTGSQKRYPFLEKPGRHGLAHARATSRTGDLATRGPLLDRTALLDRYKALNAGQKVPRWTPIYPK